MDRRLIDKISNYMATRPIERAWLFGSCARSEETEQSDIDILINFLPGERITLFTYVHIVNDLQALTGKKVDLVENGQLKPFAAQHVEQEKILIYERKA